MAQRVRPAQLDHSTNIYFAVTLDPSSSLLSNPPSPLSIRVARDGSDPEQLSFEHAGPVGALKDVQLYGFPRDQWDSMGEGARKQAVKPLKKMDGVKAVEEQVLRQRVKREF